jgi:exopolyphosphatase/guanosine-5'-triphosphate,3'-diphosphate pyrophosphatase
MADALDKGKRQKIRIVNVEISEDAFIISIAHDEQIVLEEWSFEFTVKNFENTFGIRPELKEL